MNAAEDHWTWIEKTLAASTAKWLFVVGHYPGVIRIAFTKIYWVVNL